MKNCWVKWICLGLLSTATLGADPLHEVLAKNSVIAVVTWRTAIEDLYCAATLDDSVRSNATTVLACYSKSKDSPIFTTRLNPGLVQLEVLGLIDGPLLASWGTGSGYGFAAFAYEQGKVKKVWSGGSYLPFEMYWADPSANSFILSLADPAWVEVNGEKERVAANAELLLWQDGKFKTLGTVPWNERHRVSTANVKKSPDSR